TGTDTLSSASDTSTTALAGGKANDSFSETNGTSVSLVGGTGNDTLSANGGSGIVLAGLDGNNTYQITGPISVSLNPLATFGQTQGQTDAATPAVNTIAFPGLGGLKAGQKGITLDLGNSSPGTVANSAAFQQVTPNISLSLTGTFQNVAGTPGDDLITG